MAPTPHPTSPDRWAQLAAYLAGEGTAEERQSFARSVEFDPDRELVARASELWRRGAEPPAVNLAEAWQATVTRAQRELRATPRVYETIRPRWWQDSRHRAGIMGAACLAIMLVAGVLVSNHDRDPRATLSPSVARTYTTTTGQRAVVHLGDGSNISLGPATTLTVTPMHDGVTVTLRGQALFSVVRHANASFTVRAGRTVTRVLGTTFMVRHYEGERDVRVAVTEGRVALGIATDDTRDHHLRTYAVVDAGSLGILDDSGRVRVQSDIDPSDYRDWTSGKLVFRQTPVRDIVADLRRAYGVDIRVADTVLQRRAFTWSVSVSQVPVGDALDALATALDASLTRVGNVITMTAGARASERPAVPHSTFTPELQHGR
jgi:transmembrane sensor